MTTTEPSTVDNEPTTADLAPTMVALGHWLASAPKHLPVLKSGCVWRKVGASATVEGLRRRDIAQAIAEWAQHYNTPVFITTDSPAIIGTTFTDGDLTITVDKTLAHDEASGLCRLVGEFPHARVEVTAERMLDALARDAESTSDGA